MKIENHPILIILIASLVIAYVELIERLKLFSPFASKEG